MCRFLTWRKKTYRRRLGAMMATRITENATTLVIMRAWEPRHHRKLVGLTPETLTNTVAERWGPSVSSCYNSRLDNGLHLKVVGAIRGGARRLYRYNYFWQATDLQRNYPGTELTLPSHTRKLEPTRMAYAASVSNEHEPNDGTGVTLLDKTLSMSLSKGM